jgi:hypothetical protein
MSKVLVNVNIGDNEDNSFKKNVQVEINSIDYLVIKDSMEICSCEEFDTSWERLVRIVETQRQVWLPREWYINGEIEILEKIYENT